MASVEVTPHCKFQESFETLFRELVYFNGNGGANEWASCATPKLVTCSFLYWCAVPHVHIRIFETTRKDFVMRERQLVKVFKEETNILCSLQQWKESFCYFCRRLAVESGKYWASEGNAFSTRLFVQLSTAPNSKVARFKCPTKSSLRGLERPKTGTEHLAQNGSSKHWGEAGFIWSLP